MEREKQSRQAMESHQRNLEKLQARLINMGVTGKVCVHARSSACLLAVCLFLCVHAHARANMHTGYFLRGDSGQRHADAVVG